MRRWLTKHFGWRTRPAPPPPPAPVELPPEPPAPPPPPPEPSLSVSVTDSRASAPEISRTYRATLGGGVRIEIRSFAFMSNPRERLFIGTLTQRDGREVRFDPCRVAHDILDPDLAPQVQKASDLIRKMDRAHFVTLPARFTDRNGQTWERVKS